MAPSISQLPDSSSSSVGTSTKNTTTASSTTPPEPISVTDLFSIESSTFTGSALKATAIQSRHDFIPLGIGRPSAELYPWKNGDVSSYFSGLEAPVPIPSAPVDDSPLASTSTSTPSPSRRALEVISNEAFTYGPTPGVTELVDFLTSHVSSIHNPQYRGWRTVLSTGSTAGIEISLRIFCNRGDALLVEEKTYPGVMEAAALIGLRPVGVRMDDDGLRADLLDEMLSSWDEAQRGARKPRVLYTIPTGQNPTGITQPLDRRREIYAVAQKHGLIVIEDDPYVYLNMGAYSPWSESQSDSNTTTTSSSSSYTVPPPRSYLSLDTDGRVIRLDSFSKIMAPGLRAGWVTGSDQIVTKFLAYTENTCGIVSGVTQLLLYNLLCRQWGEPGFKKWREELAGTYRRRRDAVVSVCLRELPMLVEDEDGDGDGKKGKGKGVCTFRIPEQGMFLWVNIDVSDHPAYAELIRKGAAEEELRAWRTAFEAGLVVDSLANGVQVTRGGLFQLGQKDSHEVYIRMTFAAAKEEELAEGARRFAEVVRRHFPEA